MSRRSRARLRVLVIILALLALLVFAFMRVFFLFQRAPPPPKIGQRYYVPAWGIAAKRDLRTAIRGALAPAIANSHQWSCAVIAQNGVQLYDDRSSKAVVPASAQKLIVADAALTLLGPRYRFHTLYAAARTPESGVVDGDLWLVGSGDPSLRSDDLRRGAAKLRLAGVRAIRGRVSVDSTAIGGGELNPYWNAGDANEDFMVATSGISVDEDTVEFRVAGTSPGAAARVRLKPQSSAVRYYGSVSTGNADDVMIAATGTPNVFRLSGEVPAGIREIFYLPVHGVAHYAGVVLTRFLRAAGIAVAGNPSAGTVPIGAQALWDHPSPQLRQLVHHMMIFSDNHFAEQLLRKVGLAAERHVLATQSIPLPGLRLVDGSGLAEVNRVAAVTLARILLHADAARGGNVLYTLLPRGGIDGTLKRYHFAQARGRVRAKSGHLAAVSSLAGYVETRRHGRVVFAFLFNGSPDVADRAIVSAVDAIAQR